MAQLTINYTATQDLKAYNSWCTNNIDQSLSTWDSNTNQGILVFNEGINNIADSTFRYCSYLQSLTINEGWTRLGTSTSSWCFIFADCNNLTSAKLPNSLTFLGASAFSRCGSLHDVDFGQGLQTIGQYAFDFTALESIDLPSTIQEISSNAFVGASNITSVICRATTPPTLGSSNFQNAHDTLYVPAASVSAYQNNSNWRNAFETITNIPPNILYESSSDLKAYSTWLQNNVNQLESTYDSVTGKGELVLNPGISIIGASAFQNCTDITSIEISEYIDEIEQDAFDGCTNLLSVTCYATTPPVLGSNNFNVSGDTLYVPVIAIPDYQNDTDWSSAFTTITNTPLRIEYTATSDLSSFSTWLTNNVISSTYDSGTGKGELVLVAGVTQIGDSAFNECTALTDIVLPEGLTLIDNSAFHDCSNLVNVEFPNSLTAIMYNGFAMCTSLSSVNLSNTAITTLYDYAFLGCFDITSVELPASLDDMENGVFWGCRALQSIILPNTLTKIGTQSFDDCSSLLSVICFATTPPTLGNSNFTVSGDTLYVLPSALTAYQNDVKWSAAFTNILEYNTIHYNATSDLKSVRDWQRNNVDQNQSTWDSTTGDGILVLNHGVNKIGGSAFWNVNALKTIDIPASIEEIENSAFGACYNLTSVTLHEGLLKLGYGVFQACSVMTSINIPSTVNFITSNSTMLFSQCTSLASITVDSNNTVYDSRNNCNAIIETATNKLICGCKNSTIPNTIVTIGYQAFVQTGLISAAIPASVTSIENSAFSGCSNSLTSITVDSNNTVYDSRNNCNCIIETSTNKIIIGCRNSTIPNSILIIGSSAFNGCTNLTSITLPEGLTTIENSAFIQCTQLPSINIPSTVTSIESSGFRLCLAAQSITVDSDNTVYDSRDNCNCIIETATNKLITGCKNSIIPEGIVIIDSNAFESLDISSITLPSTLTTINTSAFWNNSNLKSVTCLATTPPTINGSNFSASSDTLYVPVQSLSAYQSSTMGSKFSTVTYIPGLVITYSSSVDLTGYSTWLQNNVNTLGSSYDSSTQTGSIMLNYDVTKIGISAFANCTTITELGIPKSITEIEENAFNGCDNLLFVICEATVPPTLGANNFTADNDTLQVPKRSIPAYQNDPAWSAAFTTIEAIPESVIYYTATANIKNYSYSGNNWAVNNIDQNQSTWDSVTGEGILYLNEGVTSIGSRAFYQCTALTSIDMGDAYTITEISSNAFDYCSNTTSIILPDTLETITQDAFSHTHISSIHIPASVTSITGTPWNNCSQYLTSITVDSNNTYYTDGGGKNCVLEISTGKLIVGCKNTIIPDDTIIINGNAFSHCPEIQSITFPEGLTTINNYAFEYCSTLTSISLPSTVTYIDTGAFYSCTNIKSVTCKATTPPSLGSSNFPASNDTLYVPAGSVNAYRNNSSWFNAFSTISGCYEVATIISGPGSISPSSVYVPVGDNVTLTITPNEGCIISDVVVDSISVGPVNSYTFTAIDADHTVEAIFKHQYTITTSAGEGGTITASATVVEGDDMTVQITPNEGYIIRDVVVDGESIGAVDTYTFTNISDNHTISASFVILYTINTQVGEGGIISPSYVQIPKGDSIILTITPYEGMLISTIFDNDTLVEVTNQYGMTYTISDIQENHLVKATFVKRQNWGFDLSKMLDTDFMIQTLDELQERK